MLMLRYGPLFEFQCYKRFTIATVVKKRWIKLKNRKHSAMSRVMDALS
jgi:hypothetical protein